MTSRQDTETERMIEEVGVAMQEEMLRTFVRSSFTVDQVVIQQAMHVTMQWEIVILQQKVTVEAKEREHHIREEAEEREHFMREEVERECH